MNIRPTMRPLAISAMILIGSVLALFTQLAAQPTEHAAFADLLQKNVKTGVVDYAGFKRAWAQLDAYLKELENTALHSLDRNDRMAFYINAYNAWTIKLILSKYPGITSIKDIAPWPGSPWKKKIVRLEGKIFTLDEIEHSILRPRFNDPRVHFAVNCASKGCPPLRQEPYIGSRLDEQLDNAARAFINDSKYNYIDGNTLYVSKIFKWFSKDFGDDIPGFFRKFAQGRLKTALMQKKKRLNVKYLDYDWSLNGK